MADKSELARLRRECDLYRRLLHLGRQDAPEPFLRDALALIVEVTEARQGYLELYDEDRDGSTPRWSLAHDLSAEQVTGVRAVISRGVIAEALGTGKTILTPSASLDKRFSANESVRMGKIEAVLCVPIGDDPPRGALYLQNCAHGLFSEDDQTAAEIFARHLAPLVDRVLACHRERTVSDHTAPIRETLRATDVIGHSAALAGALRQVALVAPLDLHVLLTGETGTGKSQLARVIHNNGPRAPYPFVALNCAALPETLLESELFGALPGAHSTATRRIEGKVESAERGTLFLDEVGELSLSAQAKLLHLMQSKEYYPLGGTKPQRANVRIIAATNIDLRQAIADKRFREDLFYRLQILPIHVPSLAERRTDIPVLATQFSAQACGQHGLPRLPLSPNALRALESAEWPGNVRQLQNAVEAAVIRAAGEHARQVECGHLFPDAAAAPETETDAVTFQEASRRFQASFLQDALERHGWNVVETARRLDLGRSSVYNLIRAFGLERKPH